MDLGTVDTTVNQQIERMARQVEAIHNAPSAPITPLPLDVRGSYVPPAPQATKAGKVPDFARLKVKKEEHKSAGGFSGLSAFSDKSKTARDKLKKKDPANKTNDPKISQKMKGQGGGKK